MTMVPSVTDDATARYRNAAEIQIREVRIQTVEIGSCLSEISSLFRLIDRSDPDQRAISWKIWQLRTWLTFSLLPFDSATLALERRTEELLRDGAAYGALDSALRRLAEALGNLPRHQANPKFHWLQTEFASGSASSHGIQVLVGAMALGRCFGWPEAGDGNIALENPPIVVRDQGQLDGLIADRIILPGNCRGLSPRMFDAVFRRGATAQVDILLYPGESFAMREALPLPNSEIFNSVTRPPRQVRVVVGAIQTTSLQDEGLDEIAILHGGGTVPADGMEEARYLLCSDGRGMFVPKAKSVLVWRAPLASIATVPVEEIEEGDSLILQPDDRGRLLDIASERQGFGEKFEALGEWRRGLEALLLTLTPEEVALELATDGAPGSALAHSVRNWAAGVVLGPGSLDAFSALVRTLMRHGKLATPEDFESYVSAQWAQLRAVRDLRHRAGFSVSRELQELVRNALHEQTTDSEGLHTVQLGNGTSIELLTVAAADERSAWVPPGSLMKLQVMRGGQWRG